MLARLLGACVWVDPSQRCTRMFRSVCQKNACAFEPVKLSFRGFESRRAPKAYRQWFGFVLRDAKTVCGSVLPCARTFYSEIRYHSAKRDTPWRIFRSNAKARLAWKRISCYPNRCQKVTFRTVPEILKFSAAAFAWMIAKQTRLCLEWLKCFSSLWQKRIDFSQSLQKHFQKNIPQTLRQSVTLWAKQAWHLTERCIVMKQPNGACRRVRIFQFHIVFT